MKNMIKSLAFVVSLSAAASAATLTGTSFDFSGTPRVAGGVLVGGVAATQGQASANFGYFNASFNVANAVTTNDLAGIFANFNIIASARVGDTDGIFGPGADYAGLFDTGSADFNANAGSPAIGRTIHGLYSVGSTLTLENMQLAWGLTSTGVVVAVDSFPPASLTVFPTQGTFLGGSTGTELTTSTFSADAIGVSGASAPALNLVAIPEPSAALLGALGAFGLLRRRRN